MFDSQESVQYRKRIDEKWEFSFSFKRQAFNSPSLSLSVIVDKICSLKTTRLLSLLLYLSTNCEKNVAKNKTYIVSGTSPYHRRTIPLVHGNCFSAPYRCMVPIFVFFD